MEGRGRGGRFSRSSSAADGGFCSLHGKRRTRHDLIPWSQQPGKMRCLPQKECTLNRGVRRGGMDRFERGRGGPVGMGIGGRGRSPLLRGRSPPLRGRSPPLRGRGVGMGMGMGMRGRGFGRGSFRLGERRGTFRGADRRDRGMGGGRGSALCRLHRRSRPIASMREVGPGVYECVEGNRCRQTMDRPMRGGFALRGRLRERRGAATYRNPRDRDLRRPLRRGGRMGPPSSDLRHDEANAAVWTPSAGAGGGAGGGLRRRYGRVERKVWCALHGKSLPLSLCEFLHDCCYVCRDPSTCLSTPLEKDTAQLVNRGCPEILCSRHHTMRNVGFLELNEKGVAYQCIAGHACRGVTVPHLGQDPAAAAEEKTAAVGLMDMEEEDGIYMGPRVSNTFLPQSGRDAVSSFFM